MKLFPHFPDIEIQDLILKSILKLACREETTNGQVIKLYKNREILCQVTLMIIFSCFVIVPVK